MIQIIKRNSSSVRFFGDDAMQAMLLYQFVSLHETLLRAFETTSVSLEDLLSPFISALRSSDTNSSIIAGCLGSIAKLLRCDFFHRFEPPEASVTLRKLVHAISRCRFECAEILGDEGALHRMLDVISLIVFKDYYYVDGSNSDVKFPKKSLSIKRYLSDFDICLVVETLFSLVSIPRTSDLFRRDAELLCISIVGSILRNALDSDLSLYEKVDFVLPRKISYPGVKIDIKTDDLTNNLNMTSLLDAEHSQTSNGSLKNNSLFGYGQASFVEIINHLCRLLDVDDQRNSDRMRSVCLVILADLIETRHQIIAESSGIIWEMFSDKVARILIQNLLYESSQIMTHLFQAIISFFGRFGKKLISQTEMLLVASMSLLSSKHSITGHMSHSSVNVSLEQAQVSNASGSSMTSKRSTKVAREFYLEIISFIFSSQDLIIDLYTRCETSLNFNFILKDLIDLLSVISLETSDSTNISGANSKSALQPEAELSLGLLVKFSEIFGFSCVEDEHQNFESPEPSIFLQERKKKKHLYDCAHIFNSGKTTDAFAFLLENGVIEAINPKTIARLLRQSTSIFDKRVIGEFFAKPMNGDVLNEFLAEFRFSGMNIEEALRFVLESFRLPGEAQQIDRIMESFASVYYRDCGEGVFRSKDAVFTLAFSIVMLNTDQHNPQLRDSSRMNLEQFIRNNKGINDGESFDRDILSRIFHAIKDREIILPNEQKSTSGDKITDYLWNEQLSKNAPTNSNATESQTCLFGLKSEQALDIARLEGEILDILWDTLVETFKSIILVPRSDLTSKTAVRGLVALGKASGGHGRISKLCYLIKIVAECLSFHELSSTPSGNLLNRYINRSELFRMLVVCLFDQFRNHGEVLGKNEWYTFTDHLLMLSEAGAVTMSGTFPVSSRSGKSDSETGADSTLPSPLPNIRKSLSDRDQAEIRSGLFSTFTSYFLNRNKSINPESSDLKAVDSGSKDKVKKEEDPAVVFIRQACRIDEVVIRASRFFSDASLCALISAFCSFLRVQKPALWTNETLVFLTDLIVVTAWNNRDRMSVFWDYIFDQFSSLARDPEVPSILREHVILGLGHLSLRIADKSETQQEVVQFFQLLCHVPPESFSTLAEPAIATVMRIVELDPPFLHGETDIWPHYFSVLALSGRSRSCGPYSFGLLTTIVREPANGGVLFPLPFFTEYVDLLKEFISTVSTSEVTTKPSAWPSYSERGRDSMEASPVELGKKALQKFALLEANIRPMNQFNEETWREYVIPVHCAIAELCKHSVREIRQDALSLLQKTLLSISFSGPEYPIDKRTSMRCLALEFFHVLLPLLEELQDTPGLTKHNEPFLASIDEVQVRASGVAARVYLTNIPLLSALGPTPSGGIVVEESPDGGDNDDDQDGAFADKADEKRVNVSEGGMDILWIALLQALLRFIQGEANCEALRESIPETIKNILLVMADSAPMDKDKRWNNLWMRTWNLIDPLLPGIHEEIVSLKDVKTEENETVTPFSVDVILEKPEMCAIENEVVGESGVSNGGPDFCKDHSPVGENLNPIIEEQPSDIYTSASDVETLIL